MMKSIENKRNSLLFRSFILKYECAMKVIEPGQDRKIAALRSAFHVHFLFGGIMNQEFMDLAFTCAKKAFDFDEVPIGAVIVKNNEVIATAYNQKEINQSVTSHAEILAIEEASKKLNNWRLDDCEIYVTLDPCPMCASAIKQSRIKKVYSALSNSDSNNTFLVEKIFEKDITNPSVSFESNLSVDKAKELLNLFFKKQRNK